MVAQLAKALNVSTDWLPADVAEAVANSGEPDSRIQQMVADLKAYPGQSLLMADRQAPEVHALVHAINVNAIWRGGFHRLLCRSALPPVLLTWMVSEALAARIQRAGRAPDHSGRQPRLRRPPWEAKVGET